MVNITYYILILFYLAHLQGLSLYIVYHHPRPYKLDVFITHLTWGTFKVSR